MKIKTCDLTGDALDWAVGKAEGLKLRVLATGKPGNRVFEKIRRGIGWYCPSRSWALTGKIIEREKIDLFAEKQAYPESWSASVARYQNGKRLTGWRLLQSGPTPLIAATRCYVASKLGDEVDVPDELVQQGV